MKRVVALAIAFLVVGGGAAAGPVDVQADRIVFMDGKEFVPRFAVNAPTKLVVPAGVTETLPATGVYDAIEVAGTLRVARTRDTSVSFTHLQILPGGTLDVGTAADPIPRQFRVTFTVRNVPIDLSRDPVQWGNGILNFGHRGMVGAQKTEWTKLLAGAAAGATQVQVLELNGWEVGDELFLPDMKQLNQARNVSYRVESKVTIAAISGNTVTLSKPLDFEHQPIFDPDQNEVVAPRVANLTRNIIVRSESPTGVRGHVADVAHATWDARYVRWEGLGRTPNETLDNTVLDASLNVVKVGTRQVGRYSNHHHHVHGPGVRQCIGNVHVALSNGVVSKWADSVHNASDTLHDGNVALGFPGAGFVTEDGPETRNVYRRNVGALSKGNGKNPTANAKPTVLNCPGCEGSGLWFRGWDKSTIDQNEGWNNAIGINLITDGANRTALVPSAPGGVPDTGLDPRFAVPQSIDRNVAFSNEQNGFEWWSVMQGFFVTNLIAAHNGFGQALGGQSQSVHAFVRGAKLICDPNGVQNTRTTAFASNAAYVENAIIEDSLLAGCFDGVHGGGAGRLFRITRTRMRNVTNIFFPSAPLNNPTTPIFEDVIHEPLGSFPKRYLVYGTDSVWQLGQPLPYVEWRTVNPAQGTRARIINWQGTGQDYSLFAAVQKRSMAAVPAHQQAPYMIPEAGLTVGQAWDKYGLAWGAGVVDDVEATKLDGMVTGFVRPGLDVDLGPPRWAVTLPNLTAPAVVEMINGKPLIKMRGVLTGDQTGTKTDRALVSIDGSTPMLVTVGQGQFYDELSFWSAFVSQGSHSLVTWRVDANGNRIDSSRLEHPGYYVGSPSTPPPPPPPTEICGDGLDNDNDGQIDENPPCEPTPPPPTVVPEQTVTAGPLTLTTSSFTKEVGATYTVTARVNPTTDVHVVRLDGTMWDKSWVSCGSQCVTFTKTETYNGPRAHTLSAMNRPSAVIQVP